MLRSLIRCGALAGVVVLGACDLIVQNPNSPETARVLARPLDAEVLLGAQYLRWHGALYGTLSNVWGMAAVQSFEDFSSLANNGMGARLSIPRPSNDNAIGNGFATEQRSVFYTMAEVDRTSTNILNKFADPTFTLGVPGQNARDNRAEAFAHFMRALSVGYAALFYDSVAVVRADMGPQDPGLLVGYQEAMDSALVDFQNAIDHATVPPIGADGFPIPSGWIPSATALSATEFVKLVRSYRAKFRASVARTPAERAAVNWAAVIADAQAGITADFQLVTNTTNGPFNSWLSQFYSFSTWHQMSPFVLGMADGSDGAYAAWIAQSVNDRGGSGGFFMVSPDRRFPQGATRPLQQADFDKTACGGAAQICKHYFTNRASGSDQLAGAGWGFSNYDHVRFWSWRNSGDAGSARNGKLTYFTKAELDMLQAEGLIRTGSYAAAAALINLTRTACGIPAVQPCTANANGQPGGNLPAITVFDNTSPVPGGADCVPKIPVGPNYNTVACGNLFEAMKYEKRIETAYSNFAAWFLDMRGWGDLSEGTGLDWAAPYEDLAARGRTGTAIYSTGGVGGYHSAAKGTYGW